MGLDHPPGAVPQLPLSGPSARIIMERAERQVVPGETASFPFIVRADHDAQSLHHLSFLSKNGHFDRAWAHIVGSSESKEAFRRYVLEIRPTHVQRQQFGTYPLLVT